VPQQAPVGVTVRDRDVADHPEARAGVPTSQDLAFYYQVYGASRIRTSQPRLDVAYIFLAPDGRS